MPLRPRNMSRGISAHFSRSQGCLHTPAPPMWVWLIVLGAQGWYHHRGTMQWNLITIGTKYKVSLSRGHEVGLAGWGFTMVTTMKRPTPISWPIRWSSSMMNNETSWMSFRCFHLLDNMSQCSGVEMITLPYMEIQSIQGCFPTYVSHTVLSIGKSLLVSPVSRTTCLPRCLPNLFSQSECI